MKRSILTFFIVTLSATNLWSQNYEVPPTDLNLSKNNVAVDGYDLTTYFTQEKPAEGSKKWQSNIHGVRYYFVNEANKLKFDANPKKFLPEFGGWCAYAIGTHSKKVKIDPESYTIEEGKLYLCYKGAFNDTREKWLDNHEALKPKAHSNWKKIIQ